MQCIDKFKWLTEVLQYLGGSPLQVVTTERQQYKKITISFEIPSRQDVGTMIQIVASGRESSVQMTYERRAIEACLFGTSELWLSDSRFVMVQNQSTSTESTRYYYSLRNSFTRKSI